MKKYLILGILLLASGGISLMLTGIDHLSYLEALQRESRLTPGSSSPYCPTCYLEYSEHKTVIGVVLMAGGAVLLVREITTKEGKGNKSL